MKKNFIDDEQKREELKNMIKKLVKLAYFSAFLYKKTPISLFLLAPPGQSKTHYILKYKTKYSNVSTDLSYMGIINQLRKDKTLKHIVIPDFIKVSNKKKSTADSTIGLLCNFMEEGIFEINLGNNEKIDFKGRTGGVITATTRASYAQNFKKWNAIGFDSRFIFVSWEYSQLTLDSIMKEINTENKRLKQTKMLKAKITDVYTESRLNAIFNKHTGNDLRKLIHFQDLAKCNALMNGRNKVMEEDINEVLRLGKIINTDFTII